MSEASEAAYEWFHAQLGQLEGTGEWFSIDQDLIDRFAEVTLDFAPIHVDPVFAATGPFGGTIAHGLLTLSLLPVLTSSVTARPEQPPGKTAGVNYGFDKVRFVSPVHVNSQIRGHVTISGVELLGDAVDLRRSISVEIRGVERPALIADWVWRTFYA